VSRRTAKPIILVTLFAVAAVSWVVAQGWNTTMGLVSFGLLIFGVLGLIVQRFAN
jgi:hypothetical protein